MNWLATSVLAALLVCTLAGTVSTQETVETAAISQPSEDCPSVSRERVEQELPRLLVAKSAQDALNNLRLLPPECVIPALAVGLEGGVYDDNPLGRSFAYELLYAHHAEEHPAGYRALLAGLGDRYSRQRSIQSLRRVSDERTADVVERLSKMLTDETVPSESRGLIFEALGKLGWMSEEARLEALGTLNDPSAEANQRTFAAIALARVYARQGALASLLAGAHGDDQAVALLSAIGSLVTQHPAECDAQTWEAMREFALERMETTALEVRRTALQVGVAVQMQEWISRDDVGAGVSPALSAALERLATSDEAPEIREAASHARIALESLRTKAEAAGGQAK